MNKIFHICSIVNNFEQYNNMLTSFALAGFTDEICRFSVYDNSLQNIHEPYSVINEVLEQTKEPYLIMCHQDVVVNQGHDINHLLRVLNSLNRDHKQWAVSGNAGVTYRFKLVAKITDPHGTFAHSPLPVQVNSLDENFLVIRVASSVRCSDSLNGFHLYGTDLCLNALRQGYTCHVINFHITHLSGGNSASEAFKTCVDQFTETWQDKFWLCLVCTTTGTVFCFSKFRCLSRFLHCDSKFYFIVSHMGPYLILGYINGWLRRGLRRIRTKKFRLDFDKYAS